MKIKKRIIDNWSLESKDNYQLLREKVSFSDVSTHKNHIISKSFILVLASVVIVFIGITLGFGGGKKVANNDKDEAYSPTPDGNVEPDSLDYSDKDETNKPQEPGDSGMEGTLSNYEIFLMEISKPLIAKELVYYLVYSTNLNEEVFINSENINKIIDYFNNIEYQISDKNIESEQDLNNVLSFNDSWLKIYFNHSELLVFEYSNQKIVYTTNKTDIYVELVDYLK